MKPVCASYIILFHKKKEHFFDLHGSGTLAGRDDALFFSHQSLKGNPCGEKISRIVGSLILLDMKAA